MREDILLEIEEMTSVKKNCVWIVNLWKEERVKDPNMYKVSYWSWIWILLNQLKGSIFSHHLYIYILNG